MGIFNSLTGVTARKKSYNNTMHHCMRLINEKADQMGINLKNFSKSNSLSFQEKTLALFLANAAATEYSDKESMLYLRGLHFDALSDSLSDFLQSNGMRNIDFGAFFNDLMASANKGNIDDIEILSQGLFGRDFIIAERHNSNVANEVLNVFFESLIEEKSYDEIQEKLRIRKEEFAGIDPKFLK